MTLKIAYHKIPRENTGPGLAKWGPGQPWNIV